MLASPAKASYNQSSAHHTAPLTSQLVVSGKNNLADTRRADFTETEALVPPLLRKLLVLMGRCPQYCGILVRGPRVWHRDRVAAKNIALRKFDQIRIRMAMSRNIEIELAAMCRICSTVPRLANAMTPSAPIGKKKRHCVSMNRLQENRKRS